MLCSSCYRKILTGEELQIEGAIICKECSLTLFFLEQKYTNLIVFIPAIILAIIPLFRTILIKKFNRYTIRKKKKKIGIRNE